MSDLQLDIIEALDSARVNEVPYVVSVYAPEIMGVAVAIKGNISMENKENIIRTVNTLTGIGINNISVIITN